MELTKPEVRVYIDRDKAGDLGVDVKTIASAISTLIGGREVSQYRVGGNSYDVRVRLIPEQRSMFQDINSLLVRNSAGELLRLSNLVEVRAGNLSLDATTGSWNLKGGTLKNWNAQRVGWRTLGRDNLGGTLDGVTVAGDLDLSQQSGVFLTVKNGLVLDGTMLLGNAGGSTYGYVYFGDSSAVAQTFSGNASVLMGGNTNNALYNYNSGSGAAGTLTVAPSVNVHGKSGVLNNIYGTGTIIHQGTIAADVAGGTLTSTGPNPGLVAEQACADCVARWNSWQAAGTS